MRRASGSPYVLAALAALVIGLLAGCRDLGEELDMSGGSDPCAGVGTGVTLTVGIGKDVSENQEQTGLLNAWENRCSDNDVQVEVQELSPDTDKVRGTYVAAAQHRSPLSFDVIVVDSVDVPQLAELGYLRPLSVPARRLKAFPGAAVDTGRYDDRLYALPFTLNTGLLYYRADLLDQEPTIAPGPGAWARLGDLCRPVGRLVASGKMAPWRDGTGCLVTQLAAYEGRTVNALEMAWAPTLDGSGALFRKPYTDPHAVQPQAARRGLSWLVNGTAKGGLIAPVSLGARERESIEAFAAKRPKALFMRNWPYVFNVLQDEFHLTYGKDFGVRPLPWPSVLGGESMAVTSTTKYPKAAAALVRTMTGLNDARISDHGRDVLPPRELFEVGGMPVPRLDVYCTPGSRGCTLPARRLYAPVVAQSIRTARPRPVTPAYPELSEAIRDTIGDWLGRKDAVNPGTLRNRIEDATGRR